MSTYSGSRQVSASSRLTRLYIETKNSLQTALPKRTLADSPEKQLLDRKYRNQKDRLIAWGLEWRDEYNDGDIDKSVEQAGLTEIVESVLENIKGVLDEIERMNSTVSTPRPSYPIEKPEASNRPTEWTTADLRRYEDLVQDMTNAIDLLCEISKTQRTSSTPRTDTSGQKAKQDSNQPVSRQQDERRPTSPVPVYSQAGTPSVALSFNLDIALGQDTSSNLNLTKINPSLLVLPQEGPPTYGESRTFMRGAASAPIVFGHIRQSGGTLLPVMVEYARFDRIYRDTGMTLPLSRLESLHSILGSLTAQPSSTLARPIAYFEDSHQPRYGLIYEHPPSVRELQQQSPARMYPKEPATLSQLLHQTSKLSRDLASTTPPSPAPPLEERFRLAQRLVQGFSFLQERDFAHRSISSASVALFPKQDQAPVQSYDIRRPLICAVDLFSEFDLDPLPEALQQNIYRHPDDPRIKGPTAATTYEQRFDLYSLSLLILEIGLWVPLPEIYKEKYSLKDFKLRVDRIWIKKELPQKSGTLFSRCVQELFQAGDQPETIQSAVQIARALEKVRIRLEKCCAIDIEEDDFDLHSSPESTNETLETAESELTPAILSSDHKQLTLDFQNTWPSDEKRTAAPRNIFTDMHIPDDIQAEFEGFETRLLRIVTAALKNSQESSWIDIHYTGESKETAKPTICVGCTSTKRVRTAIRKNLNYNTNIFDLAVVKDAIRRSKSTDTRRSQVGDNDAAMNPGHHERPLCGSSIGAWRYREHSPAVTFGGVVLVDGEPYGMTVHHLLEDPEVEDKQSQARGGANYTTEHDEDVEDDDDEDSDDELATAFDDTLSITSEGDEEDGYTNGICIGEGQNLVLTQPALDDVDENFFPCEEDKDEDHIDSHHLGHVFASSGLRRSNKEDGVSHEIDWLLMKLDDERLQPYNVVAGAKRFCPEESLFTYRPKLLEPVCRQEHPAREDSYPRRIMGCSQLSGLDVYCSGRTSGLAQGKISQRMRWVRFAGRQTFSQVWSATGSFGRAGDSGAWIIANSSNHVCGHVLAYSDRFHTAYLSPMDVMFADMAATLGANVALPGASEQRRPTSFDLAGLKEAAASSRLNVGADAGANLGLGRVEQFAMTQRNLVARHMLLSGNPAHLEREWAARRSRLGQTA